MILLDTNVLSALMQRTPPQVVIDWLDAQAARSIWTTTVTVFEVEYGIARLPDGRRRTALETAFREVISEDLEGRILPFDVPAAIAAGQLSAALARTGRTVDVRDVQIAGIARARKAVVATRNVRHFADACKTVDPWTA